MRKIGDGLNGQRVLITQSKSFMGPVLCEAFKQHGATVIDDPEPLTEADSAARLVERAGTVDVLIANLAIEAPSTAAVDVDDEEWRTVFAHLVDP